MDFDKVEYGVYSCNGEIASTKYMPKLILNKSGKSERNGNAQDQEV